MIIILMIILVNIDTPFMIVLKPHQHNLDEGWSSAASGIGAIDLSLR